MLFHDLWEFNALTAILKILTKVLLTLLYSSLDWNCITNKYKAILVNQSISIEIIFTLPGLKSQIFFKKGN